MPFSNNIVNNYQLNSGNTPLLYPVRVLCPANVTTNISFPDQFLGRCINLKITNNDGTNAASYDYNLNGDYIESQAFGYLSVRSFLKLPISYPKTTGCDVPTIGGKLVKNF